MPPKSITACAPLHTTPECATHSTPSHIKSVAVTSTMGFLPDDVKIIVAAFKQFSTRRLPYILVRERPSK